VALTHSRDSQTSYGPGDEDLDDLVPRDDVEPEKLLNLGENRLALELDMLVGIMGVTRDGSLSKLGIV
jgi:hypothetical protein